jgi:hypothetical protein
MPMWNYPDATQWSSRTLEAKENQTENWFQKKNQSADTVSFFAKLQKTDYFFDFFVHTCRKISLKWCNKDVTLKTSWVL